MDAAPRRADQSWRAELCLWSTRSQGKAVDVGGGVTLLGVTLAQRSADLPPLRMRGNIST